MASKFSSLLTIGGLALLAFNSCVYVVDPGEKALIMNAVTGLKKTVYNQGFNLKIPFV
jgi:regulator of protease activity HflC (stomatin/prohibitin superfamily)